MIVLDTNVVSEALRPEPDENVVLWMQQLTGEVAITAITLAELLAGVRRLPAGRRKTRLARGIDEAIEPYRASGLVLAFDADAAVHYAEILAMREQAGRPIALADAEIAAICRSRRATCATRNMGDFTATGIDLIDPWAN